MCMSELSQSVVRVHFSQVHRVLDQNPEFDADGFVADIGEEFANEAPLAFQDKNGTIFYARRSRTDNSGWRLMAFENAEDTAQAKSVGLVDFEMRARRVCVEYTYTKPEFRNLGIYSGMKNIFEAHVREKGGKICRGLTGELSPDGEAVANKRNPEAEAARKLYLQLMVMDRSDDKDPYVEITSADTHLWAVFGHSDLS
jgi:hypothetical protein